MISFEATNLHSCYLNLTGSMASTSGASHKLIAQEQQCKSCAFLPQFKHTLVPAFVRYDARNINPFQEAQVSTVSQWQQGKQLIHPKNHNHTIPKETTKQIWASLSIDTILEVFSFVQLVIDMETSTYRSLNSLLFGRFVVGVGGCKQVFTIIRPLFSHIFVRNNRYPYDFQLLELWLLNNIRFRHIKSIQTNSHGLYSACTIRILVKQNPSLKQFDRMTAPTMNELLTKEVKLKPNCVTHVHITGQNDILERDNHVLGTYLRAHEPICTDSLILKLLIECPMLISLCLESMQVSAECLEPIKNHQTLKRLSLYGNFFGFTTRHAAILRQCQPLREVDLSTWIILRDSCSNEKHLEPWKILFSSMNRYNLLQQPIQMNESSSIRTLHIHHSLTDSVLRFILKNGPAKLRVLNISDNSELTDAAFDLNLENSRLDYTIKLEQLIVSRCHQLTNHLVGLLDLYLPTITYLDISACSGIVNPSLFKSSSRTVRQD